MRKGNLSVYDIQRELAVDGQTININVLPILLREEGFARLPRRRDEERPPTLKPEAAAVAAVHSLPALKLLGKERKSHVMDLVFDQAIALSSLASMSSPSAAYLAAYSSRVDHRVNLRVMAAWFEQIERTGFRHGSSLDLDFHTVPANSAEEPLEKALRLQPQPAPERHPGVRGPRRRTARALLRQRRHYRKPSRPMRFSVSSSSGSSRRAARPPNWCSILN